MRDILQLLLGLAASLLAGSSLQWLYGFIARWNPAEAWLPVAAFNSVLAMCLLLLHWPRFLAEWRLRRALWTFAPALSVLFGAFVLVACSQIFGPRASAGELGSPSGLSFEPSEVLKACALIVWIPLIEELLFRFGLSRVLQARFGRWFGVYVSSLIFALAHGHETPESQSWPQLFIPLGPFFLAFLCDLIYWRSKWVGAAILFHGACNATAFIFLAFDPRWLEWLKLLYLQA